MLHLHRPPDDGRVLLETVVDRMKVFILNVMCDSDFVRQLEVAPPAE